MYSVVPPKPQREPTLIVVSASSQTSLEKPLIMLSQCVTGRCSAPAPSGPDPDRWNFVFQNGLAVVVSWAGFRSSHTSAPPTPVSESLRIQISDGLPNESCMPERKPASTTMRPVKAVLARLPRKASPPPVFTMSVTVLSIATAFV